MTILSDIEIRALCSDKEEHHYHHDFGSVTKLQTANTPMITPFIDKPVRYVDDRKVISYGLSSFGYDVRLDTNFKLFTNINSVLVDPKDLNHRTLVDIEPTVDSSGTYVIIPPNSYLLGNTIECFDIPDNIIVTCTGKSTLARAGLGLGITPIEPGFQGHVVIEISNGTSLPVKVYANEGISQFLFFRGNMNCMRSYRDKLGKYQGQARGITLPIA